MQLRVFWLFILLILFSCQPRMVDQQNDTDSYKEVESVKEYVIVPKTNPEYWTEPKGLMFVSEDFYDEQGRKTKIFYRNGDMSSHGPSYDLVKKYYYIGKDLVKMRREGRDTIDTEIKSYKDRKVKIEYLKAKGNLVGINYITLDKFNNEIRRIDFNFSYFNQINEYNISYSIVNNELSGDKKTTNYFRGQFKMNKNSLSEMAKANLSELQNIQSDYYEKFMSNNDNYHDREVVSFYKDNKLIKEKTGYFGYYKHRVDSTLYFYDLRGLLIKKKMHFGVYDGDYKYMYSYRE